MVEYIQAWQCVGCGKIEAPQTCIGVCRDRKILMVGKDEYERALDALRQARELLQRIAHTTPRDGQWQRSYQALQEQAREAIAKLSALLN
ncbi:MAG: hypothetical protein ACREPT_11140 [Rudaea sp.]